MSKHIKHTSELISYNSVEDLPEELKELVNTAKKNLSSSYSPYSGFQVASAVKLENGKIIIGSNQENIAYPSGLCAERVAIFSAGSNYPGVSVETIAITANSSNGEVVNPVTPCGACRQVMIELECAQEKPITVVMTGFKGEVWVTKSVGQLIPFYFTSDKVNRQK